MYEHFKGVQPLCNSIMYVCIYIYIYIYIYTCTHIYTRVRTEYPTLRGHYIHVHACTLIYTHVRTQNYIGTPLDMHHICMHVCM